MERRMRELDRLDARFGLGVMPSGRPAPRPRRSPGRRGQRALVTGSIGAVTVALVITALAFTPGQAGNVVRDLTGLNQRQRQLAQITPPGVGSYAFTSVDQAGEPVTYDPCKTIPWVINPTDAPADYLSFIAPAFERVQAATGLRFRYDGTSDDPWQSRQRGLSSRPILVTFNEPDDVPRLQGDAIGLGGSMLRQLQGRDARFITGSIALEASWFQAASDNGRTAEQQAIVMHELGHVVGLDHVEDPAELMAPKSSGQLDFGPGDLTGLARLGAGPCD